MPLRFLAWGLGGAVLLAAGPVDAAPVLVSSAPALLTLPDRAASGSELSGEEASVLAPAVVESPQSPRRVRWFGRVSIGAVYRWAFDESMLGGALEGELGAHDANLAGGVRLRIEVGKMVVELPYQVVSFGPFVWLPALGERVRVGFGLDAGALLISRRTMPGSTLWSVLLGGQVRLGIDLCRIGPTGALQLDAGLAVAALTSAPGPLTVASTVGVGYRP